MELWIRSQDKTNLTKVNNLYIPMSRTEEIWCIKQNELYLGYYKSKERALEVLDEIQQVLVPKFELIKGKIEGSFDGTIFKSLDKGEIQQISCYIYEMPQE